VAGAIHPAGPRSLPGAVSPRHPLLPSAAGALVGLAVLAVGCADSDPVPAADPLAPAVAAELAETADLLAERVAADAPCEALEQADRLDARATEGAMDDTVPVGIAQEIQAVTAELRLQLTCDELEDAAEDEDEPEPAARPSADEEQGDAGSGKPGKGKGQDKGKGRGR
jgi:hypothetical protein